jgi:phage-related minor tail protein
MAELEGIDELQGEVEGLERGLSQTAGSASVLSGELQGVRGGMAEVVRDLGRLEAGFSGGLRRAIDGLVIGGQSASEALSAAAETMLNTVYRSAMAPVTDQLGSMLAEGLNGVVSGMMPFADGAPFSQGRVMPFAQGGVVSGPVSFPMRGGTGLMGEAGPEAIMPLARGPDGRLGIEARGGGGAPVNVTMHVTTPDVRGFSRSQGQIAAELGRLVNRGLRNR